MAPIRGEGPLLVPMTGSNKSRISSRILPSHPAMERLRPTYNTTNQTYPNFNQSFNFRPEQQQHQQQMMKHAEHPTLASSHTCVTSSNSNIYIRRLKRSVSINRIGEKRVKKVSVECRSRDISNMLVVHRYSISIQTTALIYYTIECREIVNIH